MTDQQHPITPPLELVRQWMSFNNVDIAPLHLAQALATQAARWGADQELETCCEWLEGEGYSLTVCKLRAARRPKPPSLKERALQAWAAVEAGTDDQTAMAVIRRALEALPE